MCFRSKSGLSGVQQLFKQPRNNSLIRPLTDKEAGEGCQAVLAQDKGEPQVFIQNTSLIQFVRSHSTMPLILTFPTRSSTRMRDREKDSEAVIHGGPRWFREAK